jgi:hypothetical protein
MAMFNGRYKMIEGPPHNRKRSSILLCECCNMEFLMFDTEDKETVMDSLGTCLKCERPTVGGYIPERESLNAKNAAGVGGAGCTEAGTKKARIAGERVQEGVEGADDGDWQMELFGSVSPERRYGVSFESSDSANREGGESVRSADDGDWETELFVSVSPRR